MMYVWNEGKGVVMERVGGEREATANNFSNHRTSRDWPQLEPYGGL